LDDLVIVISGALAPSFTAHTFCYGPAVLTALSTARAALPPARYPPPLPAPFLGADAFCHYRALGRRQRLFMHWAGQTTWRAPHPLRTFRGGTLRDGDVLADGIVSQMPLPVDISLSRARHSCRSGLKRLRLYVRHHALLRLWKCSSLSIAGMRAPSYTCPPIRCCRWLTAHVRERFTARAQKHGHGTHGGHRAGGRKRWLHSGRPATQFVL